MAQRVPGGSPGVHLSGCARSSGYTELVTTKETLHELIDSLSDHEAAELLARLSTLAGPTGREDAGSEATSQSFWDYLDEVSAVIPERELKRLEPLDQVDEVVYRRHGR